MKPFTYGNSVLFIGGDNEGQFARFIGYTRDSGYYVPEVELADGTHVKPWDYEIVSEEEIQQKLDEASRLTEEATRLTARWAAARLKYPETENDD